MTDLSKKPSLAHQDWTPVTLTRTLTKEEAKKKGRVQTEKRFGAGGNKQSGQNMSAQKLEKNDLVPGTVTHELADAIQKARVAKKMTQDQVAKSCSILVGIVKDYENKNSGRTIDRATLAKIGRALGVRFEMPKAKLLVDPETKPASV